MHRRKPEGWESSPGAATAPLKAGYSRREPEKIEKMFGGKTRDWSKKKAIDSLGREIHYYQGPNGLKVGMKLAGENDPF